MAAVTPAPAPDPLWIAEGAGEGDPVVYVRDMSGTVHPCAASSSRHRQLTVNGLLAEHVADDADGTWIYQQRRT